MCSACSSDRKLTKSCKLRPSRSTDHAITMSNLRCAASRSSRSNSGRPSRCPQAALLSNKTPKRSSLLDRPRPTSTAITAKMSKVIPTGLLFGTEQSNDLQLLCRETSAPELRQCPRSKLRRVVEGSGTKRDSSLRGRSCIGRDASRQGDAAPLVQSAWQGAAQHTIRRQKCLG